MSIYCLNSELFETKAKTKANFTLFLYIGCHGQICGKDSNKFARV